MNLAKLTTNHLIAFFLGSICLGLLIFSGRNGLQAIAKSLSVDETVVVSSAIFLNKKGIDEVLEKIGVDKEEAENKKLETREKDEEGKKEASESWEENSNLEDLSLERKTPVNVEIINSSGVNGAASQLSQIFDKDKTNIILENGEEILDESKVFYKNGYIGWKTIIDKKLLDMGFSKVTYEEFDEDLDLRIVIGGEFN